MNNSMDKSKEYEDIINLPHHVSNKHEHMSIEERSAQFAPFAALTGYGDAVKEISRTTEEKREIDEELKEILDSKLQVIRNKISSKPEVTFTYFVRDLKKFGGKYITVTGRVNKIDEYRNLVILDKEIEIPILDLVEIRGDIF